MKNYKIKNLILLFLCSAALLSSCKKYINETPINAATSDNFWTTEQAAQTGLAGAYSLLRTALLNRSSYFTFGDATAGEFTGFNGDIAYTYGGLTETGQYNFNYTPYGDQWHDWTPFYQMIAQCNLIITKVPDIPSSAFTDEPTAARRKLLGEAYFLRAFAYYYITEVWGQPVLITQAYQDPTKATPVPRSTDVQAFAQVVSDLKQSISMLQYGYTNPTEVAVRANKGSAFALLAKTYMWQKQYKLAADAADSVITKGGYKLERGNYANIWSGGNQESIFELYMLYNGSNNEAAGGAFNNFLQEPFVKGVNSSWTVNTDLINNLYDTTSTSKDIRVKANFYGLQNGSPLLIKYANVVYQNATGITSAYISNNLVIMRLADIYLTRAEAAAKLGDVATGNTYLNLVRQRAGLDDYIATDATDLLYTVMDERGRELYGEGSWYFDLYRSGLIVDGNYENAVQGYSTPRYLGGGCQWPLAMSVLLPQDPLLVQNAWWAIH